MHWSGPATTAANYKAFTWASEAADAATTTSLVGAEVFPEPRTPNDPVYAVVLATHSFNHFFPWELNQDGTAEETLNHVGRHELGGSYTEGSIVADPNLTYYVNPNLHANALRLMGSAGLLHLREDRLRRLHTSPPARVLCPVLVRLVVEVSESRAGFCPDSSGGVPARGLTRVPLKFGVRCAEDFGVEPRAAEGAEEHQRRVIFEVERAGMLARRISLMAGFFVVSVGVSALTHRLLYPERLATILPVFGAQLVVSLVAVVVARVERLQGRLVSATAVLALLLIWLANLYVVRVGSSLEELAFTLVAMLVGASVGLPWTWRAQLAIATGVLLGFTASAPLLTTAMNPLSLGISLVTLAILTVVATSHVDRYRYEAFEQTLVQRGEAEIAAALVRVGETLHAHLRDPEMLEEVNRLATEILACDWSGTYLWDKRQAVFVLRALCAPPGGHDPSALAAITFGGDDLPLLQRLRSERIVEISDGAHQNLIAPELIRHFGIASALYTPIVQEDRISGVLVHGYRERTGPFSRRQHRLALGIAQAIAVAVENARLFQEVQAASALKSEFVATMSHELRTPLNIIFGYADLLQDDTSGVLTDQQLDFVARISRSANVLLELVSATLNLGRLEAGHASIDRTAVGMEEVLEAVGAEVHALAAPELSVTWSAPADLVVVTDRDKLKTIVKNLVANAVKFTPAGRVHAEALWADDLLTVRVEDTGIGIPEDQHAAIFERFRQLDGSSTRRFGGVGLGLHIVQRLTQVLGGSVRVESVVGVGSAFSVAIPCPRAMVERLGI